MWVRRLVGAVGAAVAGGLAGLAFAPTSWSGLLPVALIGMAWLIGATPKVWAIGYGLAFGAAWNAVGVSWVGAITPAAVWWLLGYQTLVVGLAWFLVRLAWPRAWLAAALFFAVEAGNARWPFGGFGWLRIGYLALDTPLASAFPLVGGAALGFFMVWASFGLAKLIGRKGWVESLLALLVLGGVVLAGMGVPQPIPDQKIPVGYVQGGAPGGGIFGIGGPGDTTQRHLRANAELAAAITAEKLPRPAFVVWPENGIDTDPTKDAVVGQQLTAAAKSLGVPILVGGFAYEPRFTRSYWWTGAGPTKSYDKIHIVPFGEYVPFRELIEPYYPILKSVGPQSEAGKKPGIFSVASGTGNLKFGDVICFDVAYPETLAPLVAEGAEFLVVQSSNAMFTGTGQQEQQFAITRVRAAELHRDILAVTTNGQSGLIRGDGSVAESYPTITSAVGVAQLTPRADVTWAARFGLAFEVVLATVLPGGGILLAILRRKKRRS